MHKYYIDTKSKIIKEIYIGKIYLQDLVEGVSSVFADKSFDKDYGVLVDFRDSELMLSTNEIDEFKAYHIGLFKNANNKIAFLISNPRAAAISMIFTESSEYYKYAKVFSTEIAALKYLNEG